MRVLVYSLQSSGSSLFCYWLSQLDGCFGIVDLFNRPGVPPDFNEIGDRDAFLKGTISMRTRYKLNFIIRKFEPDKKILFVRDPVQNYMSLSEKRYNFDIEYKFRMMEEFFSNWEYCFDVVQTYEDFITEKYKTVTSLAAAGIPVDMKNYEFNRSFHSVASFNRDNSDSLSRTYNIMWGFGNIHRESFDELKIKNRPVEEDVISTVRNLCPNLVKFYEQR